LGPERHLVCKDKLSTPNLYVGLRLLNLIYQWMSQQAQQSQDTSGSFQVGKKLSETMEPQTGIRSLPQEIRGQQEG
jgi:hypothetical protein